MKAKVFLSLSVVDMVKQLDVWADAIVPGSGEAADGADPAVLADFDEFVTDFTDKVLLPFPEGSTLESLSDMVLNVGGPTVLPMLRLNALEKVRLVTNWAPLAGFAASLPD
jgi:hypothetical protein